MLTAQCASSRPASRAPSGPSPPLRAWLQTRMSRWPQAPAAALMSRAGASGESQVEFGVVNAGPGVGQRVAHAADHRLEAAGIFAPRLVTVVRAVVVEEQRGPQRGQAPGHGVADASAAADAGHHGGPATQWERVWPQLVQGRLSRSHHAPIIVTTPSLRTNVPALPIRPSVSAMGPS